MNDHVKKELYSWGKSIVFALVLVFVCRTFLFTPVIVKGESMEPTFEENDKLIVSKISKINRFDQIVFQAPNQDEQHIKRVIGLPGDTVVMEDDVLYVNGESYEEPYVNRKSTTANKVTGDFTLEQLTGKQQVPKGFVFVLGDNRLKSGDSRLYGFISKDEIIGEVKFRYYPLKQIGIPR
mgnify:CR=1 FL=1